MNENAAQDPKLPRLFSKPRPSQPRPDDMLAELARAGDGEALSTLYHRHAGALLEYLARRTRNRAEAEDLLQETFLKLLEARGVYQSRGRFRAWLFTIATNQWRDRRRSRNRQDELDHLISSDLAPSSSPNPFESVRFANLNQDVDQALADLPPSYVEAFHLRIRNSLSYAEMAAVCGAPEGTLRSRVHHALKRVRDQIGAAWSETNSSADSKERSIRNSEES